MSCEDFLKGKITININWKKEADSIKKSCKKKLMGFDCKYSSYGLVHPHHQFRYILAESGGVLTCNEKKRSFNYYLNDKGKIVLTERFVDSNLYEPYDYIFYIYEEEKIVVYFYNIKFQKIYTMHYLKLNSNGDVDIVYKISPPTKDFCGYEKYTFEYQNGELRSILREFKYSNFFGKPRYKSSRTMIDCDDNNMTFDKEKMFNDLFEKISSWEEEDIYAISLYYEESDENFSVTLGYNTLSNYEDNIINASGELEAKWNYAFWLQNEELVFNFKKSLTLDKFINNLVSVVKKLHESKILIEKFGKKIPIIIHKLEYYDEIVDINIKANTKSLIKELIEFVYN